MTIKRTAGLLCLIAVSVMTAPFAKADQADNAKEAAVVLTDIGGTPEDIALKGKNGENAMLGLDYEGKKAVVTAVTDGNSGTPLSENNAGSAKKAVADSKIPPSPESGGFTREHYYKGQALGEMAGIAASFAIMILAGAPALMITSAVVGAGLLAAFASKNRNPSYIVAASGAIGAVMGYVFPIMLVAAGGVLLGPKIADWLSKR